MIDYFAEVGCDVAFPKTLFREIGSCYDPSAEESDVPEALERFYGTQTKDKMIKTLVNKDLAKKSRLKYMSAKEIFEKIVGKNEKVKFHRENPELEFRSNTYLFYKNMKAAQKALRKLTKRKRYSVFRFVRPE